MKLPGSISQIFGKSVKKKELFLSLFLDPDGVTASVWDMGEGTVPVTHHSAVAPIQADTWEERTQAADTAIAQLEQHVGTTDFHNVTLGLPAIYLTDAGEIQKDVRGHIKKLTEALGLKPMGFVPMHQAIVYALKKEEGVPPSIILAGVDVTRLTVAVYKIGNLAGLRRVEKGTDVALAVEEALKGFQDLEVLPSRILLYGIRAEALDEVKHALLQYPWPTRVNFLHFPKIDILTMERLIGAVTLAGASELGAAIGEEEVHSEEVMVHAKEEKELEPKEAKIQEEIEEQEIASPRQPAGARNDTELEEPNVVMVTPEELGFQKEDVLENLPKKREQPEEVPKEEQQQEVRQGKPFVFPHVALALPKLSNIPLPHFQFPRSRPTGALAGLIIAVAILFGFLYWNMPSAIVTVYEIPKTLTSDADITIDPTATIADSMHGIIPGQKLEKSMSGEKTIAVTGKKQVGDPAKGIVTITNRTLSTLQLARGTVLSAGDLEFTLDSDVTIASATAFTLTASQAPITARAIGSAGNLAAGTVFTVRGYSLSDAAAKTDQALSGGTSRDITVVSRQDMDALVKSLTQELVGKAKSDLSRSVAGNETLIDETLSTALTDKQFTQELDQEANQLQGKITISVSGIAYKKEDITTWFTQMVTPQIPQGYTIVAGRTAVTLTKVKVKNDGSVAAHVAASSAATPVLDTVNVQRNLAGRSLKSAQDYLRGLPGVGGAAFDFRWSPGRSRLPINPKNISVTVAIQE